MADQTGYHAPAASPLVGREREQSVLHDALAAALAGRGSLVLVGGEAGIGKTALAEWLLAEAARLDAPVLVGRCYDLAETPPYGPWAAALAHAPRAPGSAAPPDFAGGASTSQPALFAAVRDYLAAQRPLVLLLDDLHWADPASLDLLRALARGLADLPVLLLATYRPDELTRRHALYQLLPALVREARAARLDLRPLGEPDLRALVRARYALGGDDEARLVAYLAAHAEGNPFYTGELLRTLEGERVAQPAQGRWTLGDLAVVRVPLLLRQVIDARVDRLGEEARGLLAVAAVIGQEVPLALLAAVGAVADAALLEHVERAVEARLLVELADGAGIRFTHALIREALYEGLPPLRRRAWHRRAGEALVATPAPDPDAVAYHFRQAGDERACPWLVRAGERAQRTYAWLTAAERFEAAVTLLGTTAGTASARGWLLFHIGRLRRYADPQGSIAYLDEAARLAAVAADRALAASVPLERGLFRCFVGEIRRGIAEMEAGVAAYDALPRADRERIWPLRTDDRSPIEDDTRGTLALWLALAGRYAEGREMGERAVYPLDAHQGVARALAGQGEPDAAARRFERARAAYRATGHHAMVAVSALAQLELVALPYRAERLAERRDLVAEALQARALAGGVVDVGAQHLRHLDRVLLLEVEGRWAEARASIDAFRATGGGARWAAFPSLFARLAHHQGDVERAQAVIREWLPDGHGAAPGDTAFVGATGLQRVAAALAVEAGDLPLARAWLAAHDRWLAWAGAVLGRAEAALGWAVYHRAAGDLAAAREQAERALAYASAPRQPLALLAAHRFLGELDSVTGRHADAAGRLGAALALADACAALYERALTLLALAELRDAAGQAGEAAAALAEARAILADLGAAPALARADALARRLAAPPPAARAAAPFGLTARELEVLRLVAEGLTDPQVADRLFVSRHTVNAHLKAIYGKLGVTSRAAATRLALAHHLA